MISGDALLPVGAFICPLCNNDVDTALCSDCQRACLGLMDYAQDCRKVFWFQAHSAVSQQLLRDRLRFYWPSMICASLIQEFAPKKWQGGANFHACESIDQSVYRSNCQLADDLNFFLAAKWGHLWRWLGVKMKFLANTEG